MIPLDPFDLGLDDVSRYPTCLACRKKSDGAVKVTDEPYDYLCGTHYDEWMLSPEYKGFRAGAFSLSGSFAAFVRRLRDERYSTCWIEK
jgi:hypothetical protein